MGSRSFCSPAPDLVLIMKKKRREGQKRQRETYLILTGWLRCLCNHMRRAKLFLTGLVDVNNWVLAAHVSLFSMHWVNTQWNDEKIVCVVRHQKFGSMTARSQPTEESPALCNARYLAGGGSL